MSFMRTIDTAGARHSFPLVYAAGLWPWTIFAPAFGAAWNVFGTAGDAFVPA